MKYVVLHNHPENLWMNQQQRDLLFATGNVIAVKECSLYSFQKVDVKHIERRPLTVILWGMADRYNVASELNIDVIEVSSWGEAHRYCDGYRPTEKSWTDEDNKVHPYTEWRIPQEAEKVTA